MTKIFSRNFLFSLFVIPRDLSRGERIVSTPKTEKTPRSLVCEMVLKLGYAWTPVVLWALCIFYLSGKSMGTSDLPLPDYVFHSAEYFIFATLLFRALKLMQVNNIVLWVFTLSLMYAISDEYHQSFVPGRYSDYLDVISDTIGVILALINLWILLPKMPSKLKKWAKKLDLI
ncbi:VanZ family protein [Candidatus Woesebacteria bacterium]|nr:MAG: VanZ family protein [Candidatus Woesebacteria bacterium]